MMRFIAKNNLMEMLNFLSSDAISEDMMRVIFEIWSDEYEKTESGKMVRVMQSKGLKAILGADYTDIGTTV